MILYTLPNCSGCNQVKAALARAGKTVATKNCADEAIAKELNRLGARKVPALVVDGQVITDVPAILRRLGV